MSRLPEYVARNRVHTIELGCGTAYVSAWLARRGARPTGIDVRPAFGLSGMESAGDSSVEFHLSHGDWIRLLRRSGFEVVDQIDVRPPEGASTRYPFVTLDWARQWPCEEICKARRVGAVPAPRVAMPTSADDWP